MTMLDVDRCKIPVTDTGRGDPVLLLHGNPDSSEVWDGVIARLRDRLRCIAPDLPGFGRSVAPRDVDYSLDGMAHFVDRLVGALGLAAPLHLVVHDIGGPFGLAWAVKHPEKVRSVTVMNTVFQADYRWHRFGRLWRTPFVGELVQALTTRSGFAQELRRASSGLSREQIDRTYALVTPSVKRHMLQWYRATDPRHFTGWEERLRAVLAAKPSQVLWAQRDPYIPARFADRFGAREVHRFDDLGHWLQLEAPARVADRIRALVQ